MPKHKKERREDEIERKIRKYERRLAKYRETVHTPELDPEVDAIEVYPTEPDQDNTDQIVDPDPTVDTVVLDSDESRQTGVALDNEALDDEFLTALGESGSVTKYGQEVHNEIFNAINKILLEGLTKANKDKLMETLLIPSNCKLLDAPRLNTELLAVLNGPSRTRDKLLEDRQQEMGVAIGGICDIMNSLSRKEFDKFAIIKKMTDITRLLSHLHFQYTEIRRKLVNPFLDRNLVEALKDNKREDFLYSNLDGSVKSYSALKRAASIMKTRPTVSAKNLPVTKNFQQPPRRSHPANQVHPMRGSFRGAHRFNNPRQPFRPLDNRPMMAQRGRARYP